MHGTNKHLDGFATAAAAVALLAGAAINAGADTYYASPTGSGTGTEDSPYSLTAGIKKVTDNPSSTLILKGGTYKLDGAIALAGAGYGLAPTIVRGETDNPQDVVLDAQGKSEVMRVNQNVIVSGITMMNGSNKGFASDKYSNRASGVRVGWTTPSGTLSVVSNCVITCCTNEFTSSTKVSGNEVCGGAVAVFGNGCLLNSVVTNNTAVYRGGGVVVLANGVVRNCQIVDNSAVSEGGGLFVERDATGALVADSTISDNRVSNGSGAGVANITATSTSLTLTNCTIKGNSASSVGGGLYLNNGTMTQCLDCHFEENEAVGGGGVRVYGAARGLFSGCVFDSNRATANSGNHGGGACYVNDQSGSGSARFTNCVFRGNTSARYGGAYHGGYDKFSRAEFVGCVITNNSSTLAGGGIHVRDSNNTTEDLSILMRNCLVAFNSSSSSSGGGIFLAATNAVVDSCTIVSNSSSGVGGGLCHRWGGSVTNTIIAFNLKGGSMETTSSWCLNVGTPSDAYRNCCVWPAASSVFLSANGCVNADPKFADAANGDFQLSMGSPCKNAGILESWMADASDLAGKARVYGNIPDIGCYELKYPMGLVISFK